MSKGRGKRLFHIATKQWEAKESMLSAACVIAKDQKVALYNGKRKKLLSKADQKHFIGSLGKRGRKLPKGFQSFQIIEVL